jgi:hypothetical protein
VHIEDKEKRKSTRCKRKFGLFKKAYELSTLCGGQALVYYKDEFNKVWVYCSDDDIWEEYCSTGIRHSEGDTKITTREAKEGKKKLEKSTSYARSVQVTPTKLPTNDCNYVNGKYLNSVGIHIPYPLT